MLLSRGKQRVASYSIDMGKVGMPVRSATAAAIATAASTGARIGREPSRALRLTHGGEWELRTLRRTTEIA